MATKLQRECIELIGHSTSWLNLRQELEKLAATHGLKLCVRTVNISGPCFKMSFEKTGSPRIKKTHLLLPAYKSAAGQKGLHWKTITSDTGCSFIYQVGNRLVTMGPSASASNAMERMTKRLLHMYRHEKRKWSRSRNKHQKKVTPTPTPTPKPA